MKIILNPWVRFCVKLVTIWKQITNGVKWAKKTNKTSLIPVDTFSGKVHVKWDNQASLTPLGQLAFFIEFLKTSGLFNEWVDNCPMIFTSPNAPSKRDILGTILLSVLAGHKRYAHITSIRCDNVNPGLLGMNKISSASLLNSQVKTPQSLTR